MLSMFVMLGDVVITICLAAAIIGIIALYSGIVDIIKYGFIKSFFIGLGFFLVFGVSGIVGMIAASKYFGNDQNRAEYVLRHRPDPCVNETTACLTRELNWLKDSAVVVNLPGYVPVDSLTDPYNVKLNKLKNEIEQLKTR